MINEVVLICLGLGLVCALVAGVFQSFSDFVMKGISNAKPSSGIEVMQHINRTVFRSLFLKLFLAAAPLTMMFAIYAWFQTEGFGLVLILAAALIYIVTVFVVTTLGNVPMNERLEQMEASSTEATAYWQVYCRVWIRWNHVRTIGCVATAACYLISVVWLV